MNSFEQSPPICPSCNRALMSRVSPLCSWCGTMVPAELLFSPEEIQKIEEEEAAVRKERAAKEEEIQKKKTKKAIISGVIDLASAFIPIPGPGWKPPTDDKA